jgi:hypothetical protein
MEIEQMNLRTRRVLTSIVIVFVALIGIYLVCLTTSYLTAIGVIAIALAFSVKVN